jgi:tRNA threonylcarbamoyladenosine biosynthesis protein TsaE
LIQTENSPINVLSRTPEETLALGERLAGFLAPGSVVALKGPLGAGKTCLAKGIARGLGIEEEITSPTYPIVSEYPGPCPLYHIDAYRLSGDDDFTALGGEELIYGEGISVVEWCDRIPASIPPGALFVDIEIEGESARNIRITGPLPPEFLHDKKNLTKKTLTSEEK